MTTMEEFKRLPRITVRTIYGWASNISRNTPARVVKAQVIYTTKSGERRVFGEAVAKNKIDATEAAYAKALEFFNE